MKAIKKPVTIDFFDITIEGKDTLEKLKDWVETFGDEFEDVFVLDPNGDYLRVKTREGHSYNISAADVIIRGVEHDESKLHDPEKGLFDKYTPILAKLQYGSEEYKASLTALKPALDHHYANNSHHPEHYPNEVDDMDLFDVIEMFFDWKAATERTAGGDIYKSIAYNKDRFKMSEQLAKIFENTAKRRGY